MTEISYLTNSGILSLRNPPNLELEKVTYFVSKARFVKRVALYLSLPDVLNFLQALKPRLLKKTPRLADHVFRKATEHLLHTNFKDEDPKPQRHSFEELGFAAVKKKAHSEIEDAIANVSLLKFWNLFIYFEHLPITEEFEKYVQRRSLNEKNIDNDVPRTFHNLSNSKEPEEILKGVLVAISHCDQKLGYTQGLNNIAGALLMSVVSLPNFLNSFGAQIVKEVTYGCLKYILFQRGFNDFYIDGFVKFAVVNKQLGLLMKSRLPQLHSHLVVVDKQKSLASFSLPSVTSKWFFTLFSHICENPQVLAA